MMYSDAILDAPGKKVILLGNEAIARGFLEGGLQVAASYPGTPATELMETLIAMSKKYDLYVEWSVNEKVAAEVSIAASLAGLRAMVSMKGVGVNVASEPFQAFTYMGARGGIVLVTADDVGCHSSHTEQDNRFFAREAYLPIFEPWNVAEARDMAKAALFYSERWKQPVMMRITTTLAHTSANIKLGKLSTRNSGQHQKGNFIYQPERWVNLPANARRMRIELIHRCRKIANAVNRLKFNQLFLSSHKSKYGIIASGICYAYVREAINIAGLENQIHVLKIGTPYPLPERLVEQLLSRTTESVLIVEELEPFVELHVKSLAHKHKYHHIEIHGKDYLPLAGELNTQLVLNAFSQLIAKPQLARYIERCMGYPPKSEREHKHPLPPLPRPPVLCPGCAHRAVFYAINLATATFSQRSAPRKFTVVKPSDIGCYTLGYQPPLNAVDVHFCMGASIGIATGLAKALEPERHLIVCTIGDSTFFHAGIPPLLNAVFNQANITIVILDNETTAMTGYQPHPGVGYTATGAATKKLRVETIVRACGVDYVKIVDAYKLSKLITAIEGAIRYEGPSVVIARHPCRMLELQKLRAAGVKLASMYIDKAVCVNCMRCINKFGCPAMCIEDLPEAKRQVKINSTLCNGCGVCMDKHICSKRAIKRMPTASN